MVRAALRLLLAAALGAAPLLARADVYRWVDDAGATHFSTALDAIPRKFRGSAQVIPSAPATVQNPSSSRPPSPPPRPAAPAVAPVEPPPAANPEPAPSPTTAPAPAPENTPGIEPETDAPAPQVAPPAVSAPATAAPAAAAPAAAAPAVETPAAAVPEATPATATLANPQDPRQGEIAELEQQIERDREVLRQLISMPRWDSSELASDPRVREISERLPRLQAELAALRSESEH